MTYFNKTPPQDSHYSIFQRQAPPAEESHAEEAFPYEEEFPPEDDDRVYTEEDYALAPDGDAFLPDDAEDNAYAPFDDAASPFTYAGSYDTMYPMQDEEDELLEEDYEELLTEEEQQELRRSTWRLLAGLSDFVGVILGTAAILILLALLASLLNWLVSDISQTFTLWQMNL